MNEVLKLPFAVDFDGCLAESVWPETGEGAPIEDNVRKLGAVASAGHEIFIHTARPWSDIRKLERWLAEHEIPYNGIILGKFLAERYIDDRAVNSESPSWL